MKNGRLDRTQAVDLRHPVEHVSWQDCERCLRYLDLDFPTEAQWEYAARAGTTTPRWFDPSPEVFATSENLGDAALRALDGKTNRGYEPWNDRYGRHAPVGQFAANQFGLHDILGNVSEWCRDWYRASYSSVTPDPEDGHRDSLGGGLLKILRGGSWNALLNSARSSARNMAKTDSFGPDRGLRPIRRILR